MEKRYDPPRHIAKPLYNSAAMDIFLNGEQRTVDDHITVGRLLEELLPGTGRVAVEVNEEIVPRTRHHEHELVQGDRIEIVQAIGGG